MKLVSQVENLLVSKPYVFSAPLLKFIISVLPDPSARDLHMRIV